MNYEIGFVLALLLVSLVLFVSDKLRMDLVALLVLAVLAVAGLVSMEQALEGFSNPAVVTVWAMFILSAGLSATGVADVIGRQVFRMAGDTEPRIILTIMLATGVMSAFMNNIGVAALMLPVVMDIARRTGISPARLLMPMAYASLLGGLTTMIGTPPNLVAATALQQAGHEPFGLFSFTPVGLPALIAGSLFVAFLGRHLLPKEVPHKFRGKMVEAGPRLQFDYQIENRLFRLRVRPHSPLVGRTLADSRLGAVLGLNVYAVKRGETMHSDVDGGFIIDGGDILFLQGSIEEFRDFLQWQALEMASGREITELLAIQHVVFLDVALGDSSDLIGKRVGETQFSTRFCGHILAVIRGDRVTREGIAAIELSAGDRLLVETKNDNLNRYEQKGGFSSAEVLGPDRIGEVYPESETLFELSIPGQSHLTGMKISESGLGDVLQLRVVGIARKSGSSYFPTGDDRFETGDRLLVHGTRETAEWLQALQSLEVSEEDVLDPLERNEVGHTEITLSPQSRLVGQTVKALNFRKRYGLQILAIWRGGKAMTGYLWKTKLAFGDALLLSGPRERIEELTTDPDFLVLTRTADDVVAVKSRPKAIVASVVMLAVVVLVLGGVLPIAVAAIAGVVVMVGARCLSMDEAYRSIEWQSVFLIACMIPLGTAMQETGAAQWIAEGVATVAEPFGAWGIIMGLYLVTAAATTIVPTTALVLIMAPIAMDAAGRFGVPPHMIIMAVAMAASASFTSPISHPANVLVMGPGGYRFIDYVKMGIMLALVVMLTVLPMIAVLDW
ncbi:MAG: SLC13 family permease [Akkermansiaceae bacterium]|nr:SLC13 family permease [Akkermansiaceae bacterium]